jgi:pyrroloquinoline quinone (PQQ) biosynthesis protein C
MQSHKEYVDEWRKMHRELTGSDALGAELAYESYAGMSDCHCEECSAWEEASGYVQQSLNEPYEARNKLMWEFVKVLHDLTGAKMY